MYSKLKNWLATRSLGEVWPIILLLFISLILCVANYTPHTYLSGWDTLHPEFNFPLNIQRAIFGVFRTEQGLGAVAGHSHMADLPRILFLYASSIIIPTEFIRYFYIFLNLTLGPIGVYLLLQKFIVKQKLASFLGALFYLLNLGTMQIFNVPFEMFTTLFAMLPFVFYFAMSFITETGNKARNLLLFSLFIIFTAPTAYAATLWYAFFASFSIFILVYSLFGKRELKKALMLIFVTLLLNLFWISPNIYFVLNHAKEVQNANINLLFSEQAFLKNKEFGDLGSLLFFKTFYFDWNIYSLNHFTNLLAPYIDYLKQAKILTLGILFGISAVLGLIFSFIKNKRVGAAFFLPFLISVFFLINSNFPTGAIYDFIQSHFPFFKEALRFPQNKFLNMFVFFASIYFGYFCLFLFEKLKNKKIEITTTIIISLALIFYALPSFGGNLINKAVRVEIPQSYIELFDYLKSQPADAKVANLPVNSQWGWVYYDWYPSENLGQVTKPSFQGAGFLYFGIPQPLLDRDFDRWSPYNESYYREISYAIYKKNTKQLLNVIKKYAVGYIFIDKSVIDPAHPSSTLFFDESKDLIKKTGLVESQRNFGKITLYKLKKADLIQSLDSFVGISPSAKTIYNDFAYSDFGDYTNSLAGSHLARPESSVYYPFRNLNDNQGRLIAGNINFESDRISFKPGESAKLDISTLSKNIDSLPADLVLEQKKGVLNVSLYPNTPVFDNIPSSIPLKARIQLDLPTGKFLSVNQTELFAISNLVLDTPLLAGKVILNNKENTISIFDSKNSQTIEKVGQIINPFFESCDGKTAPKAEISGSSIKIEGRGSVCILIPYGFFPSIEGNIITNFGFEYKGTPKVSSCLFSQENSACKYYKEPKIEANPSLISFTYAQKGYDIDKTAIKLFFAGVEDKKINITLSNFFASYTKSAADTTLPNNFFSAAIANKAFENIYIPQNPLYDQVISTLAVKKTDNDCKTEGKTSKKELLELSGKTVVKYSSDKDSFCDHFSFANLPHKMGFLLTVTSKNEKGLPLTLCVTNFTSRRCDIYTSLLPHKDFEKEVFVLPPMDILGVGYDVNIENVGILKSPSVNYISDLEFVPIPYDFLEDIKIGTDAGSKNSARNVKSAKAISPTSFIVEPGAEAKILTLSYSFEKGFKAYVIDNNLLSQTFPFIFGKELKDQVLVDNWKNGWQIPSAINREQLIVAIVFLPQYLEFMGFIIIFAVFSILIYKLLLPHLQSNKK